MIWYTEAATVSTPAKSLKTLQLLLKCWASLNKPELDIFGKIETKRNKIQPLIQRQLPLSVVYFFSHGHRIPYPD